MAAPSPCHRGAGCRIIALATVLAGAGAVGCADAGRGMPDPGEPPAGGGVRFVEVGSGFDSPVHIASPPGDDRLFVVEQDGRIRLLRDGRPVDPPFLDITGKVRAGGERGLLSVAFHPDFAANGRFYVYYTDNSGNTRVERYRVSPGDPDRADPASASPVLQVEQPYANHNGGLLLFGPDGMLYIGLGDGGRAGDPERNGQNRNTLLGALLRIDVDGAEPYAIPPDNPFANGGGRPEIWAIGLRNPWRFSFDAQRSLIYIADVGQNRREEVNVQPADAPGLNYGWNIMEGSLCYAPPSGCDQAGLVLPAVEYDNPGEGRSVTGGVVYRGSRVPALAGHYLYADYVGRWIRSFRYTDDGQIADHRTLATGLGNITSFGEDAAGEVYVVAHNGRIYRMEPDLQ